MFQKNQNLGHSFKKGLINLGFYRKKDFSTFIGSSMSREQIQELIFFERDFVELIKKIQPILDKVLVLTEKKEELSLSEVIYKLNRMLIPEKIIRAFLYLSLEIFLYSNDSEVRRNLYKSLTSEFSSYIQEIDTTFLEFTSLRVRVSNQLEKTSFVRVWGFLVPIFTRGNLTLEEFKFTLDIFMSFRDLSFEREIPPDTSTITNSYFNGNLDKNKLEEKILKIESLLSLFDTSYVSEFRREARTSLQKSLGPEETYSEILEIFGKLVHKLTFHNKLLEKTEFSLKKGITNLYEKSNINDKSYRIPIRSKGGVYILSYVALLNDYLLYLFWKKERLDQFMDFFKKINSPLFGIFNDLNSSIYKVFNFNMLVVGEKKRSGKELLDYLKKIFEGIGLDLGDFNRFTFFQHYLREKNSIILKGSSRYPIFGIITGFWEKFVKNRLIALKTLICQCFLNPYHEIYQKRNSNFPSDKVFSQLSLGNIITGLKKGVPFASTDGTSWTDIFPYSFMSGIIRSDLEELSREDKRFSPFLEYLHLVGEMFKEGFFFKGKKFGSHLKYTRGTPMGAYCSFAFANHSHHVLLRLSILVLAKITNNYSITWMKNVYAAILGDDIVKSCQDFKVVNGSFITKGPLVNIFQVYSFIAVEILGMEINKKKSFLPDIKKDLVLLEFAKRLLFSTEKKVLDFSRIPTSIGFLNYGKDNLRFLLEAWVYYFQFSGRFEILGSSIVKENFTDLRRVLTEPEIYVLLSRIVIRLGFDKKIINSVDFDNLLKMNLAIEKNDFLEQVRFGFIEFRNETILDSIKKIEGIGDLGSESLRSLSEIKSQLLESRLVLSLDTVFCAIYSLESNLGLNITFKKEVNPELIQDLLNIISRFYDYRYEVWEKEELVNKEELINQLKLELGRNPEEVDLKSRFSENFRLVLENEFYVDLNNLKVEMDFERRVSTIGRDFRVIDSYCKFIEKKFNMN